MDAREAISEAVRRGVNIRIHQNGIQCGPPEKIDAELDRAFKVHSGEIAFILTRGVDEPRPQPIVKIITAAEVRSALSTVVLQKMGLQVDEPFYYSAWMTCSPTGDVRVEIRAKTKPMAGEEWRGA